MLKALTLRTAATLLIVALPTIVAIEPAEAASSNGWSGFITASTIYAYDLDGQTIDEDEKVSLAFGGDDSPILFDGEFSSVRHVDLSPCPTHETMTTHPFDPIEYPFDITSTFPIVGTAGTYDADIAPVQVLATHALSAGCFSNTSETSFALGSQGLNLPQQSAAEGWTHLSGDVELNASLSPGEVKYTTCYSWRMTPLPDRDRDGLPDVDDALPDEPLPPTGCQVPPPQCDGLTIDEVNGPDPQLATGKSLATFPNSGAVCDASWVPELDSDFTPQGIADAGANIWVSGYLPSKKGQSHCAVYSIDFASGDVVSGYEFKQAEVNSIAPSVLGKVKCEHGGGLSLLPTGELLVADTRALFILDPSRIGANPIVRVIGLTDPKRFSSGLNGSFLVDNIDDTQILIGHWEEKSPSRLYAFNIGDVLAPARTQLGTGAAVWALSLPAGSQGGAFLDAGTLLITASDSGCGLLYEVRPSDGVVLGVWGFGPGAEEVIATTSRVQGVFEAGAMQYRRGPFFPVVAEFDLTGITNAPDCAP